jgi:DNA replication licensing factor MCM2
LPVLDNLRTLSHEDLGKLIKCKLFCYLVYGVITTRSEIYSQLVKVFYKCYTCGHNKGPFYISKVKPTLGRCQSCQSLGPFIVEKTKAIYRNFQYVTIQESPSQVAPGRIPRCKEVILIGDIIDRVKPGEEVEVTGVFASRY